MAKEAQQLTQYELSRAFWDFTFENPEKVKPTHIAIYFFAIEHCNRLGWKEKFGLPTTMVIEGIGLKSYNTYKKHFDDISEWGFFKVIEYSKNQYSSNIIALSKNNKANNKAFNKALATHTSKHSESTLQSTGESTGSIIKPITNNNTIGESESKIFEEAGEKFILSEIRPPHAPTPQQVIECFFRQGKPIDEAAKFFNWHEGLGWMKGITPIANWAAFANRWEVKPKKPDKDQPQAGQKLKTAQELLKARNQ